jgi:hypothetical protein
MRVNDRMVICYFLWKELSIFDSLREDHWQSISNDRVWFSSRNSCPVSAASDRKSDRNGEGPPQSRDLPRLSHTASIIRIARTSQRCKLSWRIGPIPIAVQTLIAAFICYAITYPEVNQFIHEVFHSGNICLSPELLPIVTDSSLCCVYDYFKIEKSADYISWIAPELLIGSHPNYNVHLYSYGVLSFEFFESRRPFPQLQ